MAHGPTGHLFSGLFNDPKAALFHGWGKVGQNLLAPSIPTLELDPGNLLSLLLRGWSTLCNLVHNSNAWHGCLKIGTKPIVSLTPPGSALCSRSSHRPVSHSLTSTDGFNLVHTAVPPPQAHCLLTYARFHFVRKAVPSTQSQKPQRCHRVSFCAQRLSVLPQRIVSSPLPGCPVWTTPIHRPVVSSLSRV